MRIVNCRVCHNESPLGYKIDHPVFSWIIEDANGLKQLKAHVAVSLTKDMSDLIYDTGWDDKLSSLAVSADFDLLPRTSYWWTVEVMTDAGEEAKSEINRFETGKMSEPWTGKWITCSSEEQRHPIFFADPVLKAEAASARLYICGLGLYEASIGGKKVGNERLTPYCNNYSQWLQVQAYDVTEMLKTGANQLEVLLGSGWYKGRFGFSSRAEGEGFYGSDWKLIAELHVSYADGTKDVFGTDESWQVRRSNITFSNIYDGESVDLTLPELPIVHAELATEVSKLTDRMSTPVTAREELPAKELIHTPANETVLDIGQNIAGIFRLKVSIPKGQTVHLQFGEILQQGNFYRDNLRSAKAEYFFVSDGNPAIIEPKFTFYGYRFVKVEGVPNLHLEDFTALALYSQIPKIGFISTGNSLVNQLISNTEWGQKGNFIDVPTDCPQRDERMGWTGDAQVFSATALYLTDSAAFYRKYLHDLREEQTTLHGIIPDVIPSFGINSCSAVWGDAGTIIPWNLYLFTGDKSLLEEQFESMKAWVDAIAAIDGDDMAWRRHTHYGDWLALDHPSGGTDQVRGGTDEAFIADVYYRHSCNIVADAADILGKPEDAKKYRNLASKIFDRINFEFYSPSGRCCIDTQTAHLLTIRHGLNDPEKAKAALLKSLKLSGSKLKTGFVGTPLLSNVLSEIGEDRLACSLLLNEDYPGWLYCVKLGATTIWERWNSVLPDGSISSTGMNSLNHYSYGSIIEWIWRHAAGLNPAEPGFKKALLTPVPDYRLKSLDAEYRSASGTWKISWSCLDEYHINLSITVPFECEAHLKVPLADPEALAKTGNPMFAIRDGNGFTLKPGNYEAQYETPQSMRNKLTLDSPIGVLAKDPRISSVIPVDQIPESIHHMSVYELCKHYGLDTDGPDSPVRQLERVLSEIEK
ncbi:MAG: glycoside hydrolase family 78 protein [Clostridiales bacterium]|jgi:alpha-L-rhamnosidase|nr:glycoside hydrolase family 78 protein [Clostridiales bacterium]